MKQYYVYILANSSRNLYIWVTSDLIKGVYQHKEKTIDGFTKKYNIDRLVYYEIYSDIQAAIKKEKQMKKWIRQYKLNIIAEFNPTWKDLYPEICE